jgi:hypothetical protein
MNLLRWNILLLLAVAAVDVSKVVAVVPVD